MKSLSPASFNTHTLNSALWGKAVCRILLAAVQAVDPYLIVSSNIFRKGDRLQIGEVDYDLSRTDRVVVLGVGKASAPMTQAAVDVLGDRLHSGLVIIKPGHDLELSLPSTFRVVTAEHPLPGQGSLEAGRQAAALAANLDENDLLLCLISGGGSSLCVSPSAEIEIEDLRRLNAALLASGADISEINTVRKHLETLKGGGLARLAYPASVASLMLSDVIGDPVDGIASGLTAADTTTFSDAMQVLRRYRLPEVEHRHVFQHVQRGMMGEIEDTPKPGAAVFKSVQNRIIGNNLLAAQAALEKAREEGFNTMLLTTRLQGEARMAGQFLASIAYQLDTTGQPIPRPACLIAGGETTVTLPGEGLGGRNQELALAAVPALRGMKDIALVTLATDGGDGPTEAAGAVVTGETLHRALQLGLQPEDYSSRNDSYHFFEALGDLLRPGPTMTNVNDLSFIFAF